MNKLETDIENDDNHSQSGKINVNKNHHLNGNKKSSQNINIDEYNNKLFEPNNINSMFNLNEEDIQNNIKNTIREVI